MTPAYPPHHYQNHLVRITWHDPDSDWNNFFVLWCDIQHVLLRGVRQKFYGKMCRHDGIPHLVTWDEIKTIRRK